MTRPTEQSSTITELKNRADAVLVAQAGHVRPNSTPAGVRFVDRGDVRYRIDELSAVATPTVIKQLVTIAEEAAKVQLVFGDGPWQSVIHRNDLDGLKRALDALNPQNQSKEQD